MKMVNFDRNFVASVQKLVDARTKAIEKGNIKKSHQELLDSIPEPKLGKLQWPQKSDIEGLTNE